MKSIEKGYLEYINKRIKEIILFILYPLRYSYTFGYMIQSLVQLF